MRGTVNRGFVILRDRTCPNNTNNDIPFRDTIWTRSVMDVSTTYVLDDHPDTYWMVLK